MLCDLNFIGLNIDITCHSSDDKSKLLPKYSLTFTINEIKLNIHSLLSCLEFPKSIIFYLSNH